MTIRSATIEEIEVLAEMNHRLVEDMVTENWSHDRYRDRFQRWIEGHRWSVDLFVEDTHARRLFRVSTTAGSFRQCTKCYLHTTLLH